MHYTLYTINYIIYTIYYKLYSLHYILCATDYIRYAPSCPGLHAIPTCPNQPTHTTHETRYEQTKWQHKPGLPELPFFARFGPKLPIRICALRCVPSGASRSSSGYTL